MEQKHQYFIQYMIKNGISTVENATTFCEYVSKGEIKNMTHLKTLILEINREISQQFYKIVLGNCEVTNNHLVLWLNTKNDKISQLQNIYSALELEYFHSIMQEILNSEEHRITFIVCINITSTLTDFFSRDKGQKVLNKWLKTGYFVRKSAHIYLGPRMILEFTSYLKTHYPDAVCNLCSDIVFVGKQCASCQKTFHSYCINKYLSNQNKCPCCQTIWIGTDEDGEDDAEDSVNQSHMVTDDDSPNSPVMRSQTRNSEKNRNHRRSTEEDVSNMEGRSMRKRNK
ncbi:unnamed protein product [Phaedon cochleariae]|uniref:Non-structural maintenance of chromosomes element 1 homolog n=1 Tax=Phaedon cochleariae TaxID=80249 RepID=A0A9P0DEI4_PHACE|nr:unnamed protein product [Phaedon cochleariae]